MRLRRILFNAFLVLVSIALTLAAVEAALRQLQRKEAVARPAPPKDVPKQKVPYTCSFFEPDKEIVFKNRTGAEGIHKTDEFEVYVKINSEGLRDYEHGRDKEDRYVILGIGDSTTWGYGSDFENTYLRQLEKMLNGEGRRPCEVVKAGIWAHDTVSESKYLKRLIKRYRPDLVVLGFMTNDISDIASGGVDRYYVNYDGWLGAKEKKFGRTVNKYVLGKIVYKRYQELTARLKRFGRPGFAHGDGWFQDFTDIYKTGQPGYVSKAWENIFAAVMDMKKEAGSMGAGLLVVSIPEKEQLTMTAQEGYDFQLPEKVMGGFCAKNKIPFCDVSQALKMSGGEMLYFKKDPHLNPDGYRALAGCVRDYLMTSGLIEKDSGRQARE